MSLQIVVQAFVQSYMQKSVQKKSGDADTFADTGAESGDGDDKRLRKRNYIKMTQLWFFEVQNCADAD